MPRTSTPIFVFLIVSSLVHGTSESHTQTGGAGGLPALQRAARGREQTETRGRGPTAAPLKLRWDGSR